VILLHRLLLKQVSLLTLFNAIRYLLLVGFPLTIYWSMRRLGFSAVAGGVAAACSTLLSSDHRYGFEYTSYTWAGWGMYTQLWSMHLVPITLACLHRLLEEGRGYAAAIATSAVLILSHLIYSYMMAVAVLALLLVGLNRANARPRLFRLGIIGSLALGITSYFWLPFLHFRAHMGISPYEPRWKYDSFGAGQILTWLVNGDLLDHNRLPVLTLLLALGIAFALSTRDGPALRALVLFLLFLALFFGRPTWGRLVNLLPMHERLHFHRFIGGVHLAAIFLIGLGGEWAWRQLRPISERWRALAAGALFLAVMAPAMLERHRDWALNRQWMARTHKALDADDDARTILAALGELPPGRTYAGRRNNWGKEMRLGDLHFFDLLTFRQIVAITPYESFSLNADLIWHFDDRVPAHYELFNVRYVVAPTGATMPAFLRRLKQTPRYTLYRAETGGYAQFAGLTTLRRIDSQSSLFSQNRSWLSSTDPAAGRFVRYEYPVRKGQSANGADAVASADTGRQGCPGGGTISEERVRPGRIDLRVECRAPSTLVLKMTYHPNWRVALDGREAQPFMVSPSFIGVEVPAGLHQLQVEYRSPAYKTALLILGVSVLFATIWWRRHFARLDAVISSGS